MSFTSFSRTAGTVSKKYFLSAVLSSLFLAACGGGASSPTTPTSPTPDASKILSGTAATGAALGTAEVSVKGATSGEVTVTANANGEYSLSEAQVATLSGTPYLVKACGMKNASTYLCLYSATDSLGVVNATPLTHAALALATKADPATVFDNRTTVNWSGFSTQVDYLTTALQAYVTKLGLIGGAAGLVKTKFTADHTGLDAMLDAVKIVVDTTENNKPNVTLINRANTSQFQVLTGTQVVSKIIATNNPAKEDVARLTTFMTAVNAALALTSNDECMLAIRRLTALTSVKNVTGLCTNRPKLVATIEACQGDLCRVNFGDFGISLLNIGGKFEFSGRALDINDCVRQARWEVNRNFYLKGNNPTQTQRAVSVQIPTSCAVGTTTTAPMAIASAKVSVPNADGTWTEFYRLKKAALSNVCTNPESLDLLNDTNFSGDSNPNGQCGSKQWNKLDGSNSAADQKSKAQAIIDKIKANGAVFKIELFSDDNFSTSLGAMVKPVSGYIASWDNIDNLPWPALSEASLTAFKAYDRGSNFSATFKKGASYLQSADIRNEMMDKRGNGATPGVSGAGNLGYHSNWLADQLLLQINANDSEAGQLQVNYHLDQ